MSNAIHPPSAPVRPSAAVLGDLLPDTATRDLALVLASAAFVGVCAQIAIPLPWTPVPLTGQTFAVLLSGAALGPTRAAAAMSLYLAAGVAGVPLFAEGQSGWGGPSFGYIIGFVLAGAAVGALSAQGGDRSVWRALPMLLFGTVLVYAVGVPWLMGVTGVGFSEALRLGVEPFVIGDLIKVALAASLLPWAWRLIGR